MISTVELVIIDKRILRLTLDKEDIDFCHLIKVTLTIAINDLHTWFFRKGHSIQIKTLKAQNHQS